MFNLRCYVLSVSLMLSGVVAACAACPPGTRNEGGTGGKGGEEICFGTPTAQAKKATRKKTGTRKRVKRKRATVPTTTASGCPPGTRNEGGTGGRGGEIICF